MGWAGGTLLHKDVTETSFSRVLVNRLLRGGWEDHVLRFTCVTGAQDWGLGGELWHGDGAELAEHRFAPDCRRFLVTTPVNVVMRPNP